MPYQIEEPTAWFSGPPWSQMLQAAYASLGDYEQQKDSTWWEHVWVRYNYPYPVWTSRTEAGVLWMRMNQPPGVQILEDTP